MKKYVYRIYDKTDGIIIECTSKLAATARIFDLIYQLHTIEVSYSEPLPTSEEGK